MDIRGLQLHFKKEEQKFLYIIQGEDIYLKSEAENIVRKSVGKVDVELYYGDQINYEACLDSMQTLSFFGDMKLVHIKNADKLKNDFLEEILKLAESNNNKGLTVLLSFSKFDKRKKVLKSLMSLSIFIEVKTPYDNQVESWITYIAQKENLKIDREASAFLNFLVGPSLFEIAKGIQSLKDVFPGEPIDKAKVQELISKNGEEDIFKICDHLGKGELTESMLGLENILKTSTNGIAALNLFYRHFKILEVLLQEAAVNKKTAKYTSKKDLASKAGVPLFFLGNYQAQTKIWTLKKLNQVFQAIEAADLSLKSTRLKERSVFSGFFMEISKILGNVGRVGTYKESILSVNQ